MTPSTSPVGPLVGERIVLGDLQVTPLTDGYLHFVPTQFFPGTTDADWASKAHREFLDDDGMLRYAMTCFLVQTPESTVIIDCGLNLDDGKTFRGGHLSEALTQADVTPSDIDVVLFTHLHLDHVGWAATADDEEAPKPFFDRATYRCHEADWTWSQSNQVEMHAQRLAAVTERFEPVGDGESVAPGVTVRATPGHTPGHLAVVLSGGSDRAFLLGDAIHCPVQMTETDWTTFGDVDPRAAVKTREALLRELDGGEAMVGAAHFPGLRFGRLVTGAEGRTWVPL